MNFVILTIKLFRSIKTFQQNTARPTISLDKCPYILGIHEITKLYVSLTYWVPLGIEDDIYPEFLQVSSNQIV